MRTMIFLAAPALIAAAPYAPERAVEAVMTASAAGWNAGDIDHFLAVYSDSPSTSFVTSTGLLRGKAAMRARYLERYAFNDAAKRGTLSFTTLDFRLLDPSHALYIARYTLTYSDGSAPAGTSSRITAPDNQR
jgi:uncharacterized protein (TIGR02246 family)